MGTATIHDEQNLLTSSDVSAIQHAASAWPFDTHVLIANEPSTDALDDAAHRAITSPHVTAIAVDPAHHHVAVRFGAATRVHAGDFDSITKAGNAFFRSGEWAVGINAIGTRAEASAKSHVALSP